MKKHPFFLLVGITVLVIAACGGGQAPTPTVTVKPPMPLCAPAPLGTFSVNLEDRGGSGKYAFDPSELTLVVGDTVTFTLCAETEFHTFTVGDLDIDVDVDGGETVSFDFTFDQPGTFKLICTPHEGLGMTGLIKVR